MMNRYSRYIVFALILLAVLATGCSSSADGSTTEDIAAKISETQAQAMAENALQGYNTGNYATWSRDWSGTMKAAISEQVFLEFRDQMMPETGKFISIESVEMKPGEAIGVVRFEFLANFENKQQVFMLAFLEEGDKIEGVTLTPAE
jgi:hypothetical protein